MKRFFRLLFDNCAINMPSDPILNRSWVAGLEAGKKMDNLDTIPMMSPARHQAWLDGHVVGVSYWKKFNSSHRILHNIYL